MSKITYVVIQSSEDLDSKETEIIYAGEDKDESFMMTPSVIQFGTVILYNQLWSNGMVIKMYQYNTGNHHWDLIHDRADELRKEIEELKQTLKEKEEILNSIEIL